MSNTDVRFPINLIFDISDNEYYLVKIGNYRDIL